MLTLGEAPWVEYLVINEETGERTLREDTPKEIREKYEEFCLEQSKLAGEMLPK